MDGYRIEHDSMGEVRVPQDALWRAQTQRAVENFPISGSPLEGEHVKAIAAVKAAAAKVNAELGIITEEQAGAIRAGAAAIVAGEHLDHFPIDVFQTGSGTSSNMNMNEVLASLADRSGVAVHPNDHVNASQSSNDTFPTSIHVAATSATVQQLFPALDHLASTLEAKAEEFADTVKSGRTHLMDATPVMLGQELGGYAAAMRYGIERLEATLPRVAELPLGGTAVGTGINTPAGFAGKVIAELARATGLPFTEARNHFEAQGARDALVELSGQLKTIAVGLTKLCNDLRWMSSGPRTGLAEINLPDLQPGSSIMPGKVNPVLPEATLDGLRPGHRQRHRGGGGGRVGQLRAQRDDAGAGPQPPGVDPAAVDEQPAARGPLRGRCHRQRRADAHLRGVLPVGGHAAEQVHRLRERRQGRQEGARRGADDPGDRRRPWGSSRRAT